MAVFVGAETSRSLAGSSRYCESSFVYPSPWRAPQDFVNCILEYAHSKGAPLAFPMTDVAVELLGEQSLTVPIPSLAQYHALSDKYRLMRWAREAGIPIPDTHFVQNADDVERIVQDIERWPVVVKPGRSLVRTSRGWEKTSVRYANNREELRRLYEVVEELREPSMVQGRIVGKGQGVFGLFVQGQPRVLFSHQRLREKPPSGGVSVLRESVELSEPMASYALRIAKSVNWQGIMMVEFKLEAQSCTPYLMEVNARFWGSLQLAIDAGVDFPWLLYQMTVTGQTPEFQAYRAGIKSRWWLGDLDHLILRLRNTDEELNLPPDSPSKAQALKHFLSSFDRQTKSEVMRLSDPWPGVVEFIRYGSPLVGRMKHGFRAVGHAVCAATARVLWKIIVATHVHSVALRTRFPWRVNRVLVLCKGNICRSPFAAQFLHSRSAVLQVPLEVVSAGLETTPGKEAHPFARQMCRQYGIDLDRHRTMSVTAESVERADVILVMEPDQKRQLAERFPDARRKTFLLGDFSSVPIREIRDPFGGTPQEFAECYGIIEEACGGFLHRVAKALAKPSQHVIAELR